MKMIGILMGATRYRVLAVLIAVAATAVGVNAAFAHRVYEEVMVYRGSPAPCALSYAEVSHGDGYGHIKVRIRSKRKLMMDLDCTWPFDRPQHAIKVRYIYHIHDGDSWMVCQRSPFILNSTVTWSLTLQRTISRSGFCGRGSYGVWNEGHIKNGEWYGGQIWSGVHTFN